MARISYSKTKNSLNYYIIEDYKKNGKRTTRKLEKIGNIDSISILASKENIDVDTWLNNYLNTFKKNNPPKDTGQIIIIEKLCSTL